MNIFKLVKLAKNDDPTLVFIVNRWMIRNPNPILDANCIPGIIISALLLLLSLAVTIFSGYIVYSGHRLPEQWINPWIYIVLLGTAGSVGSFLFVQKFVRKVNSIDNLTNFVCAISHFEEIMGKDWWTAHPKTRKNEKVEAEAYLRKKAAQLVSLEKIPWRKHDANKFRKELFIEIDILELIALCESSREYYFQPEHIPPVHIDELVTALESKT